MKIFSLLIFFIILFFTSHLVFANGGPIDGSEMLRTGNIVPLRKENIQLQKENLLIRIEDNYVNVVVVYHLINNAPIAQEITYGFPVDISENAFFEDNSPQLRPRQNYLPSITFQLDSTKLQIINIKKQGKLNDNIKTDFEKLIPYRFWHIVKFSLPPGKEKTLVVKYRVKAYYSDWATNKSITPMFQPRVVGYDLTPAQNWGNSIIDSLNITIDGTYVHQQKGNIEIRGLPFQNTNNIFHASFKNFSLKNNKSIIILYSHNNIPLDYLRRTSIKKSDIRNIRASSMLSANHSVNNLFDLNLSTAWSEGVNGNGVGQTIEIELRDIPVYLVAIANGYRKSPYLFKANNRLKLVDVELVFVPINGIKREKIYKKTVNLSEEEIEYDGKGDIYASLISLFNPDKDFLSENSDSDPESAQDYLLRRVTLKIVSVIPGLTFDDTCISEIIIQKKI